LPKNLEIHTVFGVADVPVKGSALFWRRHTKNLLANLHASAIGTASKKQTTAGAAAQVSPGGGSSWNKKQGLGKAFWRDGSLIYRTKL
jgi:hypothetical protein